MDEFIYISILGLLSNQGQMALCLARILYCFKKVFKRTFVLWHRDKLIVSILQLLLDNFWILVHDLHRPWLKLPQFCMSHFN